MQKLEAGFALTSHPTVVQVLQGRGILVESLVHRQAELLTVQRAQDADILGGERGEVLHCST